VSEETRPTGRFEKRLQIARVLTLALLVAVAALLMLATLQAMHVHPQPFLGLFTEPTLVVNGVGDRTWSGYAAGIDRPDQVVAVDGRRLGSSAALAEALADYRPGATVTVTVRDPAQSTERPVQVRLMALPEAVFLDFFLLPSLLAWLYLAIGFWILWTQRRDEAALVFALVCIGVALIVGLLFDIYTTHRLWWAWVLAVPLTGSAILHFALVFPRRIPLLARAPWLVALAYLPGAMLGVAGLVATANLERPTLYFDLWIWGRSWGGLGVLVFVGLLAYRRIFSSSPVARSQVRTVLMGAILGFIPYVLWNLTSRANPTAFHPIVVLPWLVLFPLSVAYAIPHYRTLDVSWILRRSLLYGVLALLLIAGFFSLPLALNRVFGLALSPQHPAVLISYALLIAMVLSPTYRGLQVLLGRAFARGRIPRERALADLGQALATIGTLQDVLTAVEQALSRTIRPERAALYLLDGRLGQYVPHSIIGQTPSVRFNRDGVLATRMTQAPRAFYVSPDNVSPAELSEDYERVVATGMDLFVPIPDEGWLVLGPPPAGRRFRTQDLRFLEALAPQVTAAVGRARLITDLEWRTTELETILRIAQAVGYSVEVDDLMELIYTQIGRVLDVRNFYVALHDPKGHTLRFAFYVENGERLQPEDEWPDTEGLTGEIVRSGWPIYADDYQAECRRRGVKPGGKPGKAWMGVPLVARDRVLGVINVSSFDPHVSYTEEQTRLLRAVADQAALVLEKARLYQEMEERTRQLQALNDVGGVITSVLDMDAVLQLIMEKAVEITGAEAGSLLLIDEDTGELVFVVNLGPGKDELMNVRLRPGTGIVGQVAAEALPIIVDDVSKDERWFAGVDQQTGFITRSLLCVPLIARGRVIGVIELINRSDGRSFGVDDQNLLLAFAANAAVSIENARLFTRTDQALAARVDELSTMQRIDRELNATLDYQRVMDLTLDWAVRTTGASIGLLAGVVETEEGQRGLRFLANQGYPESLIAAHVEDLWPLDRGIIGRAVVSGEPSLVEDAPAHRHYYLGAEGMVSQITVPIRRENQIIGVMALESSDMDCFDHEALEFAARLADHAAIAIENARLFEAVQAANRAKTEFVSFVSHELKQPMTSMKGYSDLLFKGTAGELNEMQSAFLEVIRSNVARMDRLVQDLLDVSRIEAGRLRLEIQSVPVEEVVEEAVRGVREQIASKSQQLDVEIPGDVPPVTADRTRLVQILANLLSNAHKYTPEGGSVGLRLARTDGPDGQFVCCSVSDTGVGISEEDQERLFTKYFRASDPAVRNEPGTGLGLVITKSLVELQGGEIWLESELNEGSTFFFTVPVAAS
jgi:signal transduction histidine kinase